MNQEIMNEMKDMIESKTTCMIESYADVLKETQAMFDTTITTGDVISNNEIAKRADMFWNIALQRIEKEQAEAKSKLQQAEQMKMQQQMQSMPPQGMPPMGPDGKPMESPCAKKARESAEKVAVLEAEIKESKDK